MQIRTVETQALLVALWHMYMWWYHYASQVDNETCQGTNVNLVTIAYPQIRPQRIWKTELIPPINQSNKVNPIIRNTLIKLFDVINL